MISGIMTAGKVEMIITIEDDVFELNT